jgi:hypothetical protein
MGFIANPLLFQQAMILGPPLNFQARISSTDPAGMGLNPRKQDFCSGIGRKGRLKRLSAVSFWGRVSTADTGATHPYIHITLSESGSQKPLSLHLAV